MEKRTMVDKIEVLETGHVQVRVATRVYDEGTLIGQSFHRHVIAPGDDYSGEDARVQAICAATHTPEMIDSYKATITTQGV